MRFSSGLLRCLPAVAILRDTTRLAPELPVIARPVTTRPVAILLGTFLLVAENAGAVPPDSDAAAVNPFTGSPRSLEQARWALEQSRLEEQLQQSLLNRRKLEAERQRLEGTGSGSWPSPSGGLLPGEGTALPGPAPGATLAGRPTPPLAVAPTAGRQGTHALRSSSRHVAVAPPPPRVLGVRQGSDGWVLLCAEQGQLRVLRPGEAIGHATLQAVTAEGYRLDGVFHAVEVGAVRLQGHATEPPGMPEPADHPEQNGGFTPAALADLALPGGANLPGISPPGANLSGTSLPGINLPGTNQSGASLSGTGLPGTGLSGNNDAGGGRLLAPTLLPPGASVLQSRPLSP